MFFTNMYLLFCAYLPIFARLAIDSLEIYLINLLKFKQQKRHAHGMSFTIYPLFKCIVIREQIVQ